jgi:hypothetical protein
MSFGFIGFAAFLFLGFSLLNHVLEGALVSMGEVVILNQLTVFRDFSVLGIWNVPVPNMAFVTNALPHLFTWDYSFFGGNAGLIMYFLYSITAAASFGLFLVVIGLAANFFGRRSVGQ